MGRYYDIDRLAEMCRAKADTLIEGKEAFLYVAKWLELLPAADVVPKSEVEKLNKELDEVAQEFTCFVGDPHKVDRCPYLDEIEKAKTEVAREIFEEIDRMIFGTIIPNDCAIISIAMLDKLKKKYTEIDSDGTTGD